VLRAFEDDLDAVAFAFLGHCRKMFAGL
jgi:hypothetical protein